MITKEYTTWDNATDAEKVLRVRNLIRVLTGLTAHERKKHFDMGDWLEKNTCGTVGCAAGFCGIDPWFRRHGFKIDLVKNSAQDIAQSGVTHSLKQMTSPEDFFGDQLCDQVFINGVFMRGDGIDQHKAVLGAVRLYLKQLQAEIKYEKAQLAFEVAQQLAQEAQQAFNAATEDRS